MNKVEMGVEGRVGFSSSESGGEISLENNMKRGREGLSFLKRCGVKE